MGTGMCTMTAEVRENRLGVFSFSPSTLCSWMELETSALYCKSFHLLSHFASQSFFCCCCCYCFFFFNEQV